MTLDAMHWVWNHSQSKGNPRLVMLAVADKAPGLDCTARLGLTEFRLRLNAARSTVIEAIDKALASGELVIIEEARGSRAALYQLPKAVGYARPVPGSRGSDSGPVSDGYRSENRTPSENEGSESQTPRGPESGPLNQTSNTMQVGMPAGGLEIPAFARPLVDQLTAAGVIVRWNLSTSEWFELDALIKKSGIPALTEFARRQAAQRDVQYARYFLRGGWRDLPPIPAPGTERPPLRAVAGGYQPYRNPSDQSVYDEDF